MEHTFSTPGLVDLTVQNEIGSVTVVARPTDTTSVRLEAETPEGEELVRRTTVECRPKSRGHAVVVKVPRSGGRRFLRRDGIAITIEVPEGGHVAVATASADVEVNGPIGSADFAAASGEISADDVAGEVVAKSASGAVTLGDVGELRVHTSSGDLRCSRVAGRALVNSASGDVEIGAAGDRVEVTTASGSARLGELGAGARVVGVSGDVRVLALADGDLSIRLVSGNVTVGVAEGVALHVDAASMSGHVHSDIPLDEAPRGGSRGTTVDITVRSVSGSIEIERALQQVA
jgi:DUF4097 and DUF4098 domain-containing protein YvlB